MPAPARSSPAATGVSRPDVGAGRAATRERHRHHTARRYDGTNEAEVGDWYRGKYGTWLTPATGNYLLGVLSEAENKTIAAG